MRGTIMTILLLMAGQAVAQEAGILPRLYFGAGFGSNKVPDYDTPKTGLQAFGGYLVGQRGGLESGRITMAVEAGYVDTSDADRDGFWVTPVVSAGVAPSLELMVRAGAMSGHDDGLVYGIGAGYHIERNTAVRIEYVEYPEAYAVQLNVLVFPWAWPY